MIGEVAGRPATVVFAPKRAGELDRSELDASKAARLLDWRADVTLVEGLRRTYEWFATR